MTTFDPPFPQAIADLIQHSFADGNAYGQIQVSNESQPLIKTVHVHYLPDHCVFAINTHLKSQKAQACATPSNVLRGCYWDTTAHIQFGWEARHPSLSHDEAFLQSMWQRMRPQVRLAYWMSFKNMPLNTPTPDEELYLQFDVNKRPATHTVLVFQPQLWDIYEVDPLYHRKGRRHYYQKTTDGWEKTSTSILFTEFTPG